MSVATSQAFPPVMPTYARLDLAIERGEGVYLHGTDGRRYLDFMSGIAVTALGFENGVTTSWGGVAVGHGSFGLTVAAAMVAAALAVAWLVWQAVVPAAPRPVAVFTGGEPLPAGDRPGAADFAGLAESAFHPVYGLDPDRAWFAGWAGAARLADRGRAAVAPILERRPLVALLLAVSLAALAIGLG